MRPSDNIAAFDWIASGRTPLPKAYAESGVPLSCCLPLIYPAYAKILHRIDGAYQHIDDPLTEREQQILGFPDCHQLSSFVKERRHVTGGSRLWWRELADLLGLPFSAKLSHSWLWRSMGGRQGCLPMYTFGPAEGVLQEEECRELSKILAFDTEGKCYFRMADMAVIATEKPALYDGSVKDAASFFNGENFQFTPEYWWPEDRSWCVCSDYDLDFTIVAGQQTLIERLLASKILECIEVGPEIRVDGNIPLPLPSARLAAHRNRQLSPNA